MSDWLSQIKNAKKSCLVDRNLKKVHYAFENGREMVEEYNMDTNVLTRRAWKSKKELGLQDNWEVEMGDPEPTPSKDETLIQESSNQPFVTRRNTRVNLEWRIRNLPYPLSIYSVTVNPEEGCLVIKTTNNKYFKKLAVPELQRLNIVLEPCKISFSHKFNTLIVVYEKPNELIEFEKLVLKEIQSVKQKNHDMDCHPS
ncbi:unnamed protein product [Phaedon cochleariae]|uniref:Protein DPCD n=1 Tax=Phaedon cochleariae TaxID=80249 RepID=A0A9P0DQW9_PHACE|nr:unnamed protein product [Phaedon cochleariae]